MTAESTLLRLAPTDPVAVAVRDIAAGEMLSLDGGAPTRIPEAVPFGFKIALRPIAAGEKISKYRVPIGVATTAIAAGEMVHLHNLRSDTIPTQRR